MAPRTGQGQHSFVRLTRTLETTREFHVGFVRSQFSSGPFLRVHRLSGPFREYCPWWPTLLPHTTAHHKLMEALKKSTLASCVQK
jgi:hypothetical protein